MHPENGIIIKKKGVFEAKERPASFRRWYGILFNSNLYACSGASPLWVRSLWRCSTALDAYSLSAPTKNEGTLLLDRIFAVWCLMCFKAYFISRYVCQQTLLICKPPINYHSDSNTLTPMSYTCLWTECSLMSQAIGGSPKEPKTQCIALKKSNELNTLGYQGKSLVFSLEPNVNQ